MKRVYLGDYGQHLIMCAWHPDKLLLATHSVIYHNNSIQLWSATGERVNEWFLPLRRDPQLEASRFRSFRYEQANLGSTLIWLNDQHLICELSGALYVIDQTFHPIPWDAANRHGDRIVFSLYSKPGVFDCRTRSILWSMDIPPEYRPAGSSYTLQWADTGDSFVYQIARTHDNQTSEHTMIISQQATTIQTHILLDAIHVACYNHSRYAFLDRSDTLHWRNGQQTGTLPFSNNEYSVEIQYSADGKMIAVAQGDLLSLYTFEGSLIWQQVYGHPASAISKICWHPTKPILLIATWQGYLYVQDVVYRICDRYDCRSPQRVTSSFAPILSMQWDPTGTYLATSQRGATLYIWRDLC